MEWHKQRKFKIYEVINSGKVECPERPKEYIHIGELHKIRLQNGTVVYLYCVAYDQDKGCAIFCVNKSDTEGFILYKDEWWFRVLDLRAG